MAAAAAAKEFVQESLLGTTEDPPQEVRASFMKHARPDEQGELYMGSEEFVDAIAPVEEDYVSSASIPDYQVSATRIDLELLGVHR
jgi:solute carrier family 25 (mitochondrial aspartate/glutamate transporter), member 12/13